MLKFQKMEADNLHEIIFYQDKKGNKPVKDYIEELENKNDKDSRIKYNKIIEYLLITPAKDCLNDVASSNVTSYCFAISKDSSGVFKTLRSVGSKSSINTMMIMATIKKSTRLVPISFFTACFCFIPVYLPIRMVLPSVSPVIRLVTICVTCVPTDTAACASALQKVPITKRSTAPYNDWSIFAIKNGNANKTRTFTTFPCDKSYSFIL